MGLTVIFRVPLLVKTTHATYSLEHVWIVNMQYMVATVTCRVPLTVKTTYAKY